MKAVGFPHDRDTCNKPSVEEISHVAENSGACVVSFLVDGKHPTPETLHLEGDFIDVSQMFDASSGAAPTCFWCRLVTNGWPVLRSVAPGAVHFHLSSGRSPASTRCRPQLLNHSREQVMMKLRNPQSGNQARMSVIIAGASL